MVLHHHSPLTRVVVGICTILILKGGHSHHHSHLFMFNYNSLIYKERTKNEQEEIGKINSCNPKPPTHVNSTAILENLEFVESRVADFIPRVTLRAYLDLHYKTVF
jgi:hypothetical protein